jgi:hypothetical protein
MGEVIMQTETFLKDFSPTFPAFPVYICPGDYRRIECGRYTVTARVVDDTDARPDEFECYTPEQIAAWKRGDWYFVGLVLSVSIDGYTLDDHAASLWGIDCNHPGGDNAYLQEIANDLLPEAIERAETIRASLLAKLA